METLLHLVFARKTILKSPLFFRIEFSPVVTKPSNPRKRVIQSDDDDDDDVGLQEG